MGNPVRVLHVDDDPDFCELVSLHLENISASISVTTATDPEAVPAILEESPIDCLVSDFDMPPMTGLELLEIVRTDHPDLPFILLTGKGSEEIASRAISAGVTGYLQKSTGTEQYEMLANRITNAVERNRSKGALADSQRRLELLVDQSPLAVIEWSESFEVVRWNDAAEAMFGYTTAEALGSHASLLLPDDATAMGRQLREAGQSHRHEQPTVTKTGEELVCEWHNLTIAEDGAVMSMFSLVQDVTERTERRAELKRYETMVETVADGVYALDEELRFTAVNEGMVELTGYDRDRLVGSHLSLVIGEGDIKRVEHGRERTRASASDTNSIDLTLRTADGDRVPCAVRYRVQRDGDTFAGTAGVFRPRQ